jgi:hypothetical protein
MYVIFPSSGVGFSMRDKLNRLPLLPHAGHSSPRALLTVSHPVHNTATFKGIKIGILGILLSLFGGYL